MPKALIFSASFAADVRFSIFIPVYSAISSSFGFISQGEHSIRSESLKDFESITALGLYDLVKSLKEYRCFPLFFHVDTNKYPELSMALYQCLNPEKVLKKVISCRMISKYVTFLQNHGMPSDTVLFQAGPVRITLEQYYNFWKEILPGAILLKGQYSYFDPILADAEQLLSNPLQTDVKKKKGKKKSSIPHKD